MTKAKFTVRLSAKARAGLEEFGIDPDSITRPFLSSAEISAITGVDESTLHEWRRGRVEFAYVQEKKTVLYPVPALIDWLRKRLRAVEALPPSVTRMITRLDLLLPPEKLRYLIALLTEIEHSLSNSTDA